MKKYIKKIILKLMILIMLTGATVLFAPVDLIMYKDGRTTTLSSLTYTIIRFRVRFNPHGYIYCTYWGDYPNEVIFGSNSSIEMGEKVMKKHTTERIISSVIILALVIVLMSISSVGINAAETYTSISLNTLYNQTISPGESFFYTFIAPADGNYRIESVGNTDVLAYVTTPYNIHLDDNSGQGNNFLLGFEAKAGDEIELFIRHAQGTGSGSFSFFVREQVARIFTFNYGYGDINTTADAAVPYEKCFDLGYTIYSHQNVYPSSFLAPDTMFFKVINSDVLFVSGHGEAGGKVACYDYEWGTGENILTSSSLISSNVSMHHTKVAVWACCFSAADSGSNLSIAKATVNLGAKSAVGWSVAIPITSSKLWTDTFFTQLGNGATVSSAASSASAAITLATDPIVDSLVLFGNTSTTIAIGDIPLTAQMTDLTLQNKFHNDIQSYDYEIYTMPYGVTRYYKTINGYLTTDFYDVNSNGTVIAASPTSITNEELMACSAALLNNEINLSLDPVSINAVDGETAGGDQILSSTEQIIFVRLNGEMAPVKVMFVNYQNEFGSVYQDVLCLNLSDGSSIDYEDICTVDKLEQ